MLPTIWLLTKPGGVVLCMKLGVFLPSKIALIFGDLRLCSHFVDALFATFQQRGVTRQDMQTWSFLFLLFSLLRRWKYRAQRATLCLLHLGQILNACAYPLFMASPSQLSATWFSHGHRNTVTALGTALFNHTLLLFYKRARTSPHTLATSVLTQQPTIPKR